MASDDVLAFAGAEEGIYCAMHALLTKDDHAIVVTPNYQSAEQLPLSLCATEGVALRADRNWDLDLEELAAKIRPNTKLISINFPHNPTGKVIDRATFDALVTLVPQARHLAVLRRGLSRAGARPRQAACRRRSRPTSAACRWA